VKEGSKIYITTQVVLWVFMGKIVSREGKE